MYLIDTRVFRVISFIVLCFFSWTFGGLFDVAYAMKNSDQRSAFSSQQKIKEKGPEAKLSKSIEDIGHILNEVSTDINTKKSKLKAKKSEVETFDKEIRKQFADTEKRLRDAGLPEKILKRHKYFVDKYDNNYNELRNNLDAIDSAADECQLNAEIEKTKIFLEKIKPPKRHKLLDPNNLPNRSAKPTKAKPRTKPEEFSGKQLAISDKLQEQIPPHPPLLKGGLKDGLQLTANSSELNEPILLASNGTLAGMLSPEEGKAQSGDSYLSSELPDFQTFDPASSDSKETSLSDYIMLAQASDPPTSDDLAETIEVQFTPAITAKAAELGNDPVKIYNWVRNNIEFVPTYGSIQGADMCLQTKQCNAFDTSSLLIALLRVSNIHARYVEGTVEVPIDKVMNWVGGFTDAKSALDLMAAGGIPTAAVRSVGEIIAGQFEHVWVEAWVDYTPSRGSRHIEGDIWIPLDASFKQYTYTQGIDIQSAVPFDAQAFVDQIQATATINEAEGYVTGVDSLYVNQTMTNYQTQVEDYITQNYPDATVGDVIGKKEILTEDYPYLLGTMPYRLIASGQKMAVLQDSVRHKIQFELIKDVYDEFSDTFMNFTKSLPEIAGKKITLSYSPATQADEDIINSLLPEPHADGTPIDPSELPTSLPAYLIDVTPELRIDGEIVATGTTVVMGTQEDLTLTFSAPNKSKEKVKHLLVSGEYYGIAIDPGVISEEQMQAIQAKLETTKVKLEAQDFTGITKDDLMGDLLHTTATSYFVELDAMNYVQSKTAGVSNIRLPSENAVIYKLDTYSVFGVPLNIYHSGLVMDVGRNLSARKSLNGNFEKTIQFVLAAGQNSSSLEHSVPEQLLSTPESPVSGISAVKMLKIANDQGIPIYTINTTNIDSILPRLQVESDVIANIQDAVNAGKEVTVPMSNITYASWTGSGYIIFDPNTGDGAFMINGGLNGGVLLLVSMLNNLLSLFVSDADAASAYDATFVDVTENIDVNDYYSCVFSVILQIAPALIIAFIYMIAAASIGAWPQAIVLAIGFITLALYIRLHCGKFARTSE
jgi:transglutaminase-like putative cysteine protease